MTRWQLFCLGFAVGLLVMALATSVQGAPFPRVACYSGNRSNGILMLTPALAPDTLLLRRLARHEVVTLNLAPWYSAAGPTRTDALLLMRGYNPRVKILGYHLVTHWYLAASFVPHPSDRTFPASWQRALLATGGFRAAAPGGYEVNWSKREVADTLTSLLCGAAASRMYDGLFLDYCSPLIQWTGAVTARDDSASLANMERMVRRLRAAGGDGFMVVGNGTGAERLSLNGTMREGYPGTLTTFRMAQDWLQESARPMDWLQSGAYTATSNSVARYGMGTACLWNAVASGGPDRDQTLRYAEWWWDEASVEPYPSCRSDTTGRYTGWLGEPAGPAERLASGVWRRGFANGLVLVNPTSASVSVDLGEASWQRIRGVKDVLHNNGTAERVQVVRAMDAVFMVAKVRRPQ